jgi:hypothetical protein
MKITNQRLKQIIKEELSKVMLEADMSRLQAMALANRRLQDAEEEHYEADEDFENFRDEAGQHSEYFGQRMMDSTEADELRQRVDELEEEARMLRAALAKHSNEFDGGDDF